MLGLVPSACLLGIDGHAVTVEVHVSGGLPSFTVVGLPDASCREARDRVRAALLSNGLQVAARSGSRSTWPHRRCARSAPGSTWPSPWRCWWPPARSPQEAVGERAFLGELGLDGSVRPVAGTLCLTDAIGSRALVLPAASAAEASLVGERIVHPVAASPRSSPACAASSPGRCPARRPPGAVPPIGPDLADVRGQPVARYALELAAAGGHHLLLLGPPGAGKTMLSARLPGPAAAAHRRRGARRPPASTRPAGFRSRRAGSCGRPPFRAPAPRRLGGGAGRAAAPRSCGPGEISAACQRGPVPRRARRVPASGARRAAPAAGGRGGAGLPGPSRRSRSPPGSSSWRR